MLRLLRQLSLPQLRASWGRTALVVGGIATGVSLIVAIDIINATIVANLRNVLEMVAGPAELQVTLGIGEIGFPESVRERVEADPDVALAVPLVRGTIALADDPGAVLQLFGTDLTAEEVLGRYPVVAVSDRRALVRIMEDPRSILLTTTFATRHGTAIGDVIRVAAPGGIQELTVRGLIEPHGLAAAFGGALAVMDLPAAQLLLEKQGRVDQLDLVLRDGAEAATAQTRLAETLPSVLSVSRPAQRSAQYEHVIASFQAMLTGLSLLTLLVGVYIIYNTTSTGALHRALVMAELRLIGAEGRLLFRLLMLEALVLGSVGGVLGLVDGIVLARLLIGMVTDSMGVIFQLRFPVGRLMLGPVTQAGVVALGIAAALFASFFAARRVATLEPLDVTRGVLPSSDSRSSPGRFLVLWGVLVMLSILALVLEVRWRSIVWGNLGSTLWNGSVFVIAVPLVMWSGSVLRWLLPRLFGAEGRVAFGSVLRSPVRTGVTVAAVAGVLTVGITVSSLAFSHRRSVEDYLRTGWLASDLTVSAVTTDGGWLETPLPAALAAEVAALPGVASAQAVRILPGQPYGHDRIAVAGVDGDVMDPVRYPARWYREGDAAAAAAAIRRGKGANISTALADREGLGVGDVLHLDTPTGVLALPITGVVYDYISDRGTVILDRRQLVERWHDETANRINVLLKPGASVEDVRAAIQRRLSSRYLVKVLALGDAVAYLADRIDRAFAFTDAIQLLVIIVTIAGIFDLLVSRIVERRRELAQWRVVGAADRQVRRSIVIEAATIGVLGAVLGVCVGLVTAWIWTAINYRYLLGYYLAYHLPLVAVAWYVVLVMTMAILAGYGAASRATRASVLDGIQTS
jgi:putative ABC transport system permease protein